MNKKAKIIASLCLNLFVFLASWGFTTFMFFKGGNGNMEIAGFNVFKFFTIDSNLLCGLACLVYAVYQVLWLKNEKEIPLWVSIFKSSSTAALTLTFLTVVFFLGPTQGFLEMFEGSNLFLHGLNPIAAIIAFVFFENHKLGWKHAFFSIAPTFVYSIFYVLFVAVFQTWKDFYGFTFGGHLEFVPLVLLVMFGISFLIGWVELLLNGLTFKKQERGEA